MFLISIFPVVSKPKSYEEALHDEKWIASIRQELQALQGKLVNGFKWIFKNKYKEMVKWKGTKLD